MTLTMSLSDERRLKFGLEKRDKERREGIKRILVRKRGHEEE